MRVFTLVLTAGTSMGSPILAHTFAKDVAPILQRNWFADPRSGHFSNAMGLRGKDIRTIEHFDNSPNNPENPDPTKTVIWGQQSFDEMMPPPSKAPQ